MTVDEKGDVYAYDWAYRLVDARYDVEDPEDEVATPESETYGRLVQYTLDGLGNRSQVQTTPPTPAETVTYASDVVNQYTEIDSVEREHDDNGNVTAMSGLSLTWDFKDRLVSVEREGIRASYVYDYSNRRISKRIEKTEGGASETTLYVDRYFEIRDHGHRRRAPAKPKKDDRPYLSHC